MDFNLMDEFEWRMSSRYDDPPVPRFTFGHKMVQYDDGPALWIAFFDDLDAIDCEKYTIPSNLTSSEALNRWGSTRMHEFKMEILEVIG